MNGTELCGREMRINSADSKPGGTPKSGGRGGRGGGRGGGGGYSSGPQNPPHNSLIVRNLSYNTTTDSLGAAFENCSNARVITDKETGESRG
jgi:nucleolin